VVTVVDWLTGPELGLTLFYLGPVAWMAWRLGVGVGLLAAGLAAVGWLSADLGTQTHYQVALAPYWNMSVRAGVFSIVVLLIEAVRRRKVAEAALQGVLAKERDLERQLLQAGEAERQRFGLELHDGLGQQLVSIHLALSDLTRRAEPPSAEAVRELEAMVQATLKEVRRVAHGLYPAALEQNGLVMALEDLVLRVRSKREWECTFEGDPDLQVADSLAAVNLYRIAQEAMSNALKHSRGNRLYIGVLKWQGGLRLVVRDNGLGMPEGARAPGGLGLKGMHYRAQLIGAQLTASRPAEGGLEWECLWQPVAQGSPASPT
jgi:signal transduction histidine kinase